MTLKKKRKKKFFFARRTFNGRPDDSSGGGFFSWVHLLPASLAGETADREAKAKEKTFHIQHRLALPPATTGRPERSTVTG